TNEAIILAGGLGTRLQHVLPGIPKCMAPVNGKPFLTYVLDSLKIQEITNVVLSVGYRKDEIMNYFGSEYHSVSITYSIENDALYDGVDRNGPKIFTLAPILKDKMFGDFNDRQEKYLSHILTSGRHLLQLINNILDLSKVEAGKMKLNLEPFSVNRVIDEVQTIIKTLAYKKNIEIQLDLCPEVIMYGDPAKIKQILYNLLSNAIKFTPEKGLVMIHTLEAAEGVPVDRGGNNPVTVGAKSLLLSVKDTGIGISPNDQERIFLEFEQSEQTRGKGYEGTGLGLALTKKLVELHGGQIWVKSSVGQGSEFTLLLPIKGVAPDNETANSDGESA
ncbi:MAG: NTP transferase domain-containing protein, partial [Candidatus Firestonebacteria bacterium]|nr:NTP transferase domain-containing protein [Candidatus Firestonebacteria bacterium]